MITASYLNNLLVHMQTLFPEVGPLDYVHELRMADDGTYYVCLCHETRTRIKEYHLDLEFGATYPPFPLREIPGQFHRNEFSTLLYIERN